MKNTINYYYKLNPDKINKLFNYYYFYINNELYYFLIYKRKIKDINAIYEFNQKMLNQNILTKSQFRQKQQKGLVFLQLW